MIQWPGEQAKGSADPRGIEQDHGQDRYEQRHQQTETGFNAPGVDQLVYLEC